MEGREREEGERKKGEERGEGGRERGRESESKRMPPLPQALLKCGVWSMQEFEALAGFPACLLRTCKRCDVWSPTSFSDKTHSLPLA